MGRAVVVVRTLGSWLEGRRKKRKSICCRSWASGEVVFGCCKRETHLKFHSYCLWRGAKVFGQNKVEKVLFQLQWPGCTCTYFVTSDFRLVTITPILKWYWIFYGQGSIKSCNFKYHENSKYRSTYSRVATENSSLFQETRTIKNCIQAMSCDQLDN